MARVVARTSFGRKLTVLAVGSCFAGGTALAHPTGPTVISVAGAALGSGDLLQFTSLPGANIDWRSLSLGPNGITRFLQQSVPSAALSRATIRSSFTIAGLLESGGRVLLIDHGFQDHRPAPQDATVSRSSMPGRAVTPRSSSDMDGGGNSCAAPPNALRKCGCISARAPLALRKKGHGSAS
jgi:hypothetical protein